MLLHDCSYWNHRLPLYHLSGSVYLVFYFEHLASELVSFKHLIFKVAWYIWVLFFLIKIAHGISYSNVLIYGFCALLSVFLASFLQDNTTSEKVKLIVAFPFLVFFCYSLVHLVSPIVNCSTEVRHKQLVVVLLLHEQQAMTKTHS